jgi:hypothetical protein
MPPRRGAAFLILLAVLLLPSSAHAQRRGNTSLIHGPIDLGPRISRDWGNHTTGIGAQMRIPVLSKLELRPSGDLFLAKHEEMGWQANGDAAIRLGQGGGLYAGGGVAFVHPANSEIQTGYNLFFGLSTAAPADRVKPFVEFRWTFVNETTPFRLAVGFNYRL